LTEAKGPQVLAETADTGGPDADMATLARGGRLNVFGFVLRLAARLPFLFIAGRIYGAASLGRFAYAVLVVEFAAQIAALAYHHDVGATVRARSIVEPWTISIVAFVWSYVSLDDGLIVSYVFSMVAALIAALIPLVRCYGIPHGWKPDLGTAWWTACRNIPLAAADAVEWASRRVDLAVLGAFLPAAYVGIYYVAQQVATLPAKLKTSFEPVLGPAIARKIAANDRSSIAPQVRQVTYWIIAAQLGIALALGIPGRAVMGLVGSGFTGGTAALGFLLAAEVIAAAAVVSEAALIYIARKRNMAISLVMLAIEAGLAAALILIMKKEGLPQAWQATGPAIALCVALAFASITKSWLLKKQLGAPVSGWRWDLAWATAAGVVVGAGVRWLLPETWQLVFGVPAILVAFFSILWTKGFGPEDRELFRLRKEEVQVLREAEEAAEARGEIRNDLV
jgi:O-antigen/teichoic acid export membrane protein